MNVDLTILREVSERERNAARVGYHTWALFVAWAERELGVPWETIREELNRLHKWESPVEDEDL